MFKFESITREDLEFLIEIRNECRDSLHDNRKFTLAECEIWFRDKKPDFHVIWCNGERIGYFRLSNHDRENASIYIGADLHKRYRGQGLGRSAYSSFLPLIKVKYGVSTFKLEVLSHNTMAHALYFKLGFLEIGRQSKFAVRNGNHVDSIVMALSV